MTPSGFATKSRPAATSSKRLLLKVGALAAILSIVPVTASAMPSALPNDSRQAERACLAGAHEVHGVRLHAGRQFLIPHQQQQSALCRQLAVALSAQKASLRDQCIVEASSGPFGAILANDRRDHIARSVRACEAL